MSISSLLELSAAKDRFRQRGRPLDPMKAVVGDGNGVVHIAGTNKIIVELFERGSQMIAQAVVGAFTVAEGAVVDVVPLEDRAPMIFRVLGRDPLVASGPLFSLIEKQNPGGPWTYIHWDPITGSYLDIGVPPEIVAGGITKWALGRGILMPDFSLWQIGSSADTVVGGVATFSVIRFTPANPGTVGPGGTWTHSTYQISGGYTAANVLAHPYLSLNGSVYFAIEGLIGSLKVEVHRWDGTSFSRVVDPVTKPSGVSSSYALAERDGGAGGQHHVMSHLKFQPSSDPTRTDVYSYRMDTPGQPFITVFSLSSVTPPTSYFERASATGIYGLTRHSVWTYQGQAYLRDSFSGGLLHESTLDLNNANTNNWQLISSSANPVGTFIWGMSWRDSFVYLSRRSMSSGQSVNPSGAPIHFGLTSSPGSSFFVYEVVRYRRAPLSPIPILNMAVITTDEVQHPSSPFVGNTIFNEKLYATFGTYDSSVGAPVSLMTGGIWEIDIDALTVRLALDLTAEVPALGRLRSVFLPGNGRQPS